MSTVVREETNTALSTGIFICTWKFPLKSSLWIVFAKQISYLHALASSLLLLLLCAHAIEPFPPPDDFHLSSIILGGRLFFSWTANEIYRNCSAISYIYQTNCSTTCYFNSDGITISCSNITTVAYVCLFQLRTTICDNITGSPSNVVHVTLKGK